MTSTRELLQTSQSAQSRPFDDCAAGSETAPVTGTVPAALIAVPVNDAAHVCANRRTDLKSFLLSSVDGEFMTGLFNQPSLAYWNIHKWRQD
jgi:hypothetical protein